MNLLLPVVDTNSIGWTFNPPTDAAASVFVQASVTVTTGGIMLVNDSTSPGTTRYYGTDGGGVKGFFTFPVGSAVTSLEVQGNPGLQGDVQLVQGANVTLSQVGQKIYVTGAAGGVTSLHVQGQTGLQGDVQLVQGNGMTLSQVGQLIFVTNAGVTSLHVQGQTALAGDVQLIQGSNVTLTQGAGTITVAAGGGSGTETRRIPLEIRNPRGTTLPGNSYFSVEALTNIDFGMWTFVKDVDGKIYAVVNAPPEMAVTPNAKIIFIIAANATSGVTRLNQSSKCVAEDGETINVSLTADTAQDITVPGTAYFTKKVSFTGGDLTNVAANDVIFIELFHEGSHGNDTLAVNTLLVDAYLEIDVTPT